VTVGRLATWVVMAAACLSIPAVLLLLLAFVEILILPPVLVYTNTPFPVETDIVAPGEPVTFVVGRCANDPLSQNPLVYTFTRSLVDTQTGTRYGIADGSSNVPHGCEDNFRSSLSIVPIQQPNGRYYVEGTSTARGLFKTNTVRWQSQEFEVRRSD
jgi:hypothetical protein